MWFCFQNKTNVRRKLRPNAALINIFIFTLGSNDTWRFSLIMTDTEGSFWIRFVMKQYMKKRKRWIVPIVVFLSYDFSSVTVKREVISFTLLFPSFSNFWPPRSVSCLVWKDGKMKRAQGLLVSRRSISCFIWLDRLIVRSVPSLRCKGGVF